MRDRILLAWQLLNESGSIFVQIGEDNLHLVRNILDEEFGADNFMSVITVRVKNMPFGAKHLENMYDHLIWYAKDKKQVKFRRLFLERPPDPAEFSFLEEPSGARRKITTEERKSPDSLPTNYRLFSRLDLYSSGYTPTCIYDYEFEGTVFKPQTGKSWKTTKHGMEELERQRRLMKLGSKLYFISYFDEYAYTLLTNFWNDTAGGFSEAKSYVVQTHPKIIQRCMLMTTDPGDLVFDPTCGSGTTAYVAEQQGRRWITCDTSRVAVTLSRQRLMNAVFDYYTLAQPHEGVGSGLRYKTAPHVTLGSIANREPSPQEVLYNQPLIDSSKVRVTGPFTVEAVPAATVQTIQDVGTESRALETIGGSLARSGETLRQAEWRDELFKTGIRAKGGQKISFSRVEPLPATRWLHADAETVESTEQPGQRVVVSFGPEHQPLEQRQVALALEEAQQLIPKPKIIVFAAFEFDSEAAKDIDETDWPGVTLLKAKMNGDLFTEDLRKKRSSNESFWLVGQPDVQLTKRKDDQYVVEVLGFDYYNTKTGTIDSGGPHNIAMWMLDPDYDGRSLFPRQVFFPMSGEKDGWSRLAKNLKAEIDEELIQNYHGTTSLPFKAGERRRAAVKIVDDRGIESLKLIDLD